VSNASDALEKLRHRQSAGLPVREPDTPLAVRLDTDPAAGTLTISDSGVGMDRAELIDNLGTIARSGSRAFMARLKAEGGGGGGGGAPGAAGGDTGANIIGQFGVGFYSAFMVADRIDVYSRSAAPGGGGLCWSSTGDGSYTIAECEGVARGTKVVLQLKDSARDFARTPAVKEVLARYSSFLSFPLTLDGAVINSVQAIWALPKNEVRGVRVCARVRVSACACVCVCVGECRLQSPPE